MDRTTDHSRVTPVITDGVVELGAHTMADLDAHLAGEDEETARRFGWWPRASTPETVRRASRVGPTTGATTDR
jgi:hypothetical protein